MIDKRGRKINYLRVSLTDRCNLRCKYCMPEKGILKKKHEDIFRFEEIVSAIKSAAELGIDKVRFTGGEPLIIKGIEELIRETSKIDAIKDIAISTNGILLEEKLESLKEAGLKRVNISLDTLDAQKYRDITRGGDLSKVLRAIDKCLEMGLTPVKINAVLMKGFNDEEVRDFMEFVRDKDIHVRFIELMPIGEGKKFFDKGYISSKEIVKRYPQLKSIKSEEFSTAELYSIDGYVGKIGFINPMSCKFCSDCNRIRLTSQGAIKPCLHSSEEYSLNEYINDEKQLLNQIEKAIYNKPKEHKMVEEEESRSEKMMFEIGG